MGILNPPNGSWGIVQIQPTRRNVMKNENPPNGSWGMFRSGLRSLRRRMWVKSLLNALGRFVCEAGSEQSPNFRWWDSGVLS